MPDISALRLRHEHTITLENLTLSGGFTLEAWVCPAPMDNAARLYPEKGYDGNVVRLKPGLYRDLADEHLPTLGSACLPEDIEAVFFTEPDFRGEALAQRDDLHEVPEKHRQIGSAVILDRAHRRQNHVVLFEEAGYQGEAEVLILPDFWQKLDTVSTEDKPHLTQAGSAWVPPGVALEVEQLLSLPPTPFTAEPVDYKMPNVTVQTSEQGTVTVTVLDFECPPMAWPKEPPLFKMVKESPKPYEDMPLKLYVNVPPNHRLYVFEKADYDGRVAVISGKQELSNHPWLIGSAIYVATPNGMEGIIGIRSKGKGNDLPEVRLFPLGTQTPDNSVEWHFWIPPGFRLKPITMGEKQEWGPGSYKNIPVSAHQVVQVTRTTLRGDLSTLPEGVTRIEPRRDAPLTGTEMIYTTADDPVKEQKSPPKAWPDTPPVFKTVRIPEGYALFLFEQANYGGRHQIVVDSRDDLSDLPWTPGSAAYAETPDDWDGVLCLKQDVKIFAPGNTLPAETDAWFPPGYCLVKDSGERMGANGLLTGKNMNGYAVERYLGIIANDAGYGLTIERRAGELRGAPDELRFGGVLLRPDRWYHLAQTWDGQTLQWILDGRPVKQLPWSVQFENTNWVLGQGFRGAVAQLRAWGQALTADQIRDLRYPGASIPTVDGALRRELMPDLNSYAQPPDAAVVAADLPRAPADTVLVQGMQQQVDAEHQQNMQAARQDAAALTAQGRKQAQRKLARAREQARRDIHFKGIKMMGFVRGDSFWKGKPGAGQLERKYYADHQTRFLDLAIDEENRMFSIIDGSNWQVNHFNDNVRINPHDPFPPRALAIDGSGTNDLSKIGGVVYTGVYWVLSNGKFHRTWYLPNGKKTDKHKELFEAPLGDPNAWDMALDTVRQVLYWTNGRELYWSKVDSESPTYDILLPHVASPFPVAVAVALDGSLVWLDAEDEVLRMLPFDQQTSKFGKPKDLYPAPKPTRGLAVCSLADEQCSGNEAAFVYWVAKERRTLEVPVLDTPGRYIEIDYDPPGKQSKTIVAIEELYGAKWSPASILLSLYPIEDTNYGPFYLGLNESIEIYARLWLDGHITRDYRDIHGSIIRIAINNDYGLRNSIIIADGGLYNTGDYFSDYEHFPQGEWVDLSSQLRVFDTI
ncbi:MAG: hypothetical protein IPH12_01975 [Saprospirales bacterium]|nr:hypothetical protein [Saprospirales bacterium]